MFTMFGEHLSREDTRRIVDAGVRKVSNVCLPVMSGFFNKTSCDPSGTQNVVLQVISVVSVPPDDS